MEGKYIYGIAATSEEKSFYPDAARPNGRVYTLPYKDISAILSDSELIDFSSLPKDNAVRHLLRHQRVLEDIMNCHYTVVPVRLGTYALDIRDAEGILSAGYGRFKETLSKASGRIELDMAVLWHDLGSTIRRISDSPEIKTVTEDLMSRSGGISQNDQIRIGMKLKDLLAIEARKLALEMEDILRAAAIDSRAHGLMDDRMILNTAYLLDRDMMPKFEEALDALDGRYNGDIDFRCVGPLPAYSFYTMEVKKIRFNEIERSKKILCLNGIVTEDGLKRAYRALSRSNHPDRCQAGHPDEGRFVEINNAYRLLLGYISEGGGDGSASPATEGHDSTIVRVWDGR